ncbi:NIF3-like protein 1 isoform X1 [Daphnia pulicaria]|uniref:NIF3-like protein 1 isoform X1 n=1 Tax=Daphnia pulicaria TaxID=35523 RepID=UPI001EEB9AA3|nr:NIF3-like protein 1 isoform X1 [Daphnia pulicaria]
MLRNCARHLVRHHFQQVIFQSTATMSSLTLNSVVDEFNRLAPLSLAESWDNVGLLVEPTSAKIIKKILLTNDLTNSVMQEAESSSVDLIYSYHPPIFAPLKRITASNWKEKIIARCLENKIAVYSPHTALDALKGGVNDWLAEAFGSNVASCNPLTTSYAAFPRRNCTHMVEIPVPFNPEGKKLVRSILELVASVPEARLEEHISTADGYEQMTIMAPEKALPSIIELVNQCSFANASRYVRIIRVEKPPIPGSGMGRLIRLSEPITINRVVELVKSHLKLQHVRLATAGNAENNMNVETIALCAGSGASLLKNVKADVFLTGEMSHHEVLDAVHRGTSVILCEHSNTERGFLSKWKEVLHSALGEDVQIDVSLNDHDPLQVV